MGWCSWRQMFTSFHMNKTGPVQQFIHSDICCCFDTQIFKTEMRKTLEQVSKISCVIVNHYYYSLGTSESVTPQFRVQSVWRGGAALRTRLSFHQLLIELCYTVTGSYLLPAADQTGVKSCWLVGALQNDIFCD